MRTSDFNLLPVLEALLAENSVTRAAQRMHLSTPAMSHALGRIRDVTGDPMLVRAGRVLVPTPRAQAMRDDLRRLVAEAEALFRKPGVDLAHTARDFVVRAPDGIAIVYGAVLLEAIRAQIPRATLRFVGEDAGDTAALREGRVDLEIGSAVQTGPEIRTQALYSQRIVAAVRAKHPLLARRHTAARFSAQKHVAQRDERFDAALRAAGYVREIVLTVPNSYAAMMAAARSDLVATVPDGVTRSAAAALGLVTFPLPLPADRIVQAWHPRFDADAAHRHFRVSVRGVLALEKWTLSPMGLARRESTKH